MKNAGPAPMANRKNDQVSELGDVEMALGILAVRSEDCSDRMEYGVKRNVDLQQTGKAQSVCGGQVPVCCH